MLLIQYSKKLIKILKGRHEIKKWRILSILVPLINLYMILKYLPLLLNLLIKEKNYNGISVY